MRGGHDTLFIFEAGTEAFFARAVMTAISTCEISALQRPLKLLSFVTETQSNNKTLSVVLYTSEGTKLNTSWKGSDDWRAIALKARETIRLAKGGQATTPGQWMQRFKMIAQPMPGADSGMIGRFSRQL